MGLRVETGQRQTGSLAIRTPETNDATVEGLSSARALPSLSIRFYHSHSLMAYNNDHVYKHPGTVPPDPTGFSSPAFPFLGPPLPSEAQQRIMPIINYRKKLGNRTRARTAADYTGPDFDDLLLQG